MKAIRIGFLGIRTERVAETTAFFRDVVGLAPIATSATRTVTQLPTGKWDLIEVFAEGFSDDRLIRAEIDGVFVAIFVEDIEEARRDCLAARVEILGETVRADEAFDNEEYAGVAWFFARAPDGNIYVFQQVPD